MAICPGEVYYMKTCDHGAEIRPSTASPSNTFTCSAEKLQKGSSMKLQRRRLQFQDRSPGTALLGP
ncbi:hypothetical protein NQZ68_028941 [Dissostichus eleginoides]|nr:hypothetical protein NQZ68_028941 [Dissostichus eleginoides]